MKSRKLKITKGTEFWQWFEHEFEKRPLTLQQEDEVRLELHNKLEDVERLRSKLASARAHDKMRQAAFRLWEVMGL